jgi:hypothetical protein
MHYRYSLPRDRALNESTPVLFLKNWTSAAVRMDIRTQRLPISPDGLRLFWRFEELDMCRP